KVIPCCADLDLFNKNKITDTERKACFSKLRIPQDKLILSYLGSIGTWYLLDEMLDFFYVLKEQIKDAKFLFITPDKPETIINKAIAKNIPAEDIIIQKASRQEVPILLSISTVSLFFIKPVYSKKASSPTKMGEIMGMGIPIICNKNIGDIDTIMNNKSGIFLLSDFNITEYERISSTISTLIKTPSEEIREMADTYFSLKNGIQKYKEVYDYLTK
ncbi:MAG TPA: glycosyltransferase, partial [Bacteroidales bacterium]|nr:glycosyltransferase [Bacteroidales bacterium]